MKAAVVVFPGSNCDRDLATAPRAAGADATWPGTRDDTLPAGTDLVAVPGGFSFGDYLRCGAIAARSPIAAAVAGPARRGGYVLGVCNGFQVLTEMASCPWRAHAQRGPQVHLPHRTLRVARRTAPSPRLRQRPDVRLPIAHPDGNYTGDEDTLRRLQPRTAVAFTYADR
jgi:phosphoribosylformylglycinamidine synthase